MQVVQKWVSAIKTILGSSRGPVAQGLKIGKPVLDNVKSTSLALTGHIALIAFVTTTTTEKNAIFITVVQRNTDLALAENTPALHNS